MDKNMTAVEWLINQVLDKMGDIPMDIQEQAKELEMEQILDAHTSGQCVSNNFGTYYTAKQYYNATFNK